MRVIEIDGKNFSSLEGFYKSLESQLLLGDCPWGENLDSLDEIVSCQFNYTTSRLLDVTMIVWENFEKSKTELTEKRGEQTVIEIIEEILQSNVNIAFLKK